MRAITYQSIQDMVAGFLGWDPSNLSGDEQSQINRAVNRRAQFAWECFFWPEWTVCEKRVFRPAWDAVTTWAAQAQVFSYQTKKYYSALIASTNQPPADVNGVTNLAYWADATCGQSVENYSSTANYLQGKRVYDPTTDQTFQLYLANALNVPPVQGAGWGVVPAFERTIDYNQTGKTPIADVKQTWDGNPRAERNCARPVDFVLQDDGIRVLGSCPIIWVEFRLAVPSWTGAIWAAGNFAAGAQVFYGGDYYVCIAPATTELPTDATKWALIPMPYLISKYVANGAFADVNGKSEGNAIEFGTENDEAFSVIQLEFDKIERQQQQTSQLNFVGNR